MFGLATKKELRELRNELINRLEIVECDICKKKKTINEMSTEYELYNDILGFTASDFWTCKDCMENTKNKWKQNKINELKKRM